MGDVTTDLFAETFPAMLIKITHFLFMVYSYYFNIYFYRTSHGRIICHNTNYCIQTPINLHVFSIVVSVSDMMGVIRVQRRRWFFSAQTSIRSVANLKVYFQNHEEYPSIINLVIYYRGISKLDSFV